MADFEEAESIRNALALQKRVHPDGAQAIGTHVVLELRKHAVEHRGGLAHQRKQVAIQRLRVVLGNGIALGPRKTLVRRHPLFPMQRHGIPRRAGRLSYGFMIRD